MDYALNVKVDYPEKTKYSDYDGSDYSGFEDNKKRKVMEGGNGTSTVKLSRDELKSLLEPLNKEQLVALLIDAGSLFPAVADEIRDSASKDPVHRKLFVRGLAWETSSVALREAFEQYGEVEEACVITDKGTGKSRGFGFITFKHMDSAQRALKEPSKNIDGRITVCNLASAGGTSGTSSTDQAQRKLYVGGLSYETTSDTLLNIFSQYGEIEEGAIAYDKNTNKSRGFAFVTFKSTDGANRAIEDTNKSIEGRHVTVKLAAEGQKERSQTQATSGQLQSLPQVQQGYGASINSSISNYPRQSQLTTSAPQSLNFSAYAPLAYGTQGTYGSLVTNPQYGGLSTSPQPYNSSQYAQYASFVKLAAEGQRERSQTQASSGQLQSLPQVQQGYGASINSSISNFPRQSQLATSAPQSLNFSGYAPLAYGTQGTYGSLVTNPQYGGLSTSPQPYNSSQYAQYGSFGNQSTHAGIPTVGSIQGGSLSSYYTGAN